MRVNTVNDLIKFIMENDCENAKVVIGCEGYHSKNDEDKKLGVSILPTGELFIADDCDYSEIEEEPEEEYGFEIQEIHRRYVKVTAKSYDEAKEMIERAADNCELNVDDKEWIVDTDVDDYDDLNICDDVTDELC